MFHEWVIKAISTKLLTYELWCAIYCLKWPWNQKSQNWKIWNLFLGRDWQQIWVQEMSLFDLSSGHFGPNTDTVIHMHKYDIVGNIKVGIWRTRSCPENVSEFLTGVEMIWLNKNLWFLYKCSNNNINIVPTTTPAPTTTTSKKRRNNCQVSQY